VEWEELRTLALREPKPSLSCVVVQRSPGQDRTARVLHDGDKKWLIWSSEKIEFNDGSKVVIARGDRIEALPSYTYSHGWVKSMIHPRLTNLADPYPASGRVMGESSIAGVSCWVAEVDGKPEREDVVFTMSIAKATGITMRVEGERGTLELQEFHSDIALPDALFTWQGPAEPVS
jgi:hypothetical protein